jgi:hypothetical protein
MLCAIIYIKVKIDIIIDVCLFKKLSWLKTPMCLLLCARLLLNYHILIAC